MKKLELKQMEEIQGGIRQESALTCDERQTKIMAIAGMAATVVGLFGPVGAIIAAPTAIGMGVFSIICAYR